MPDLGRKYTCYSCHTKFYDLGKPVPLCPKCGADQRDAEDAPVVTTSRSRSRVVEVPVVEEPEFSDETPAATTESSDEEEDFVEADREEEEADDEEEEEDY